MSTLSVWKFPYALGAEQAEETLATLQNEQLIVVHDAAAVSWPEGAKKPKTQQMHRLKSAGALGGSFWGLLFGLIFFVPLLGLAVGAAMGGLAGALSDVGIDDDFIRDVRDQVTPGTSALFVLTSGADLDKVRYAFQGQHIELIQTNLDSDQEEQLRVAFE